jgi:hypothetical protein
LEECLLAELRMAQTIDMLAELERELLRQDDPDALAGAATNRTACLAKLNLARIASRAAATAYARQAGLPDLTPLPALVARLDPLVGLRLDQCWQGIQAHLEHAGAMAPGSRALARIAAAHHQGRPAATLRRYAQASAALLEPTA